MRLLCFILFCIIYYAIISKMKDVIKNILDIILVIIVNIFIADLNFALFLFFFLMFIYDIFLTSNFGINYNETTKYYLPLYMLGCLGVVIKYFSLPLLYNFIEKNSTNCIIKKFVYKLKYTFYAKLFILFITILPFIIFNYFSRNSLKKEIWNNFFFFCIVVGLFGSYLFLFFWWEIEKWWKSDCDKWYGSKRIKNTQLYLEINKIFNKIQDFNYQNFKKCQKIVFVIVISIYKFLKKIKKVLDKKIF